MALTTETNLPKDDKFQVFDLNAAYKIEKAALTFVGFYPQRVPKFRFLHILSGCFTITVAVGQFISMFAQMIIDINDLSKVSETLFFFITHTTYMCKMVNFIVYRKNIFDIEDTLAKPVFNNFPPNCLEILKKRIKSAQNLAFTFRIMCFVSVVVNGFRPYLDDSKKQSLPLPGWQPYDATNPKFYYPTVVFQIIAVCLTAANNVTFDCLTWILIAFASAELNILKKNLENIDYGNTKLEQVEEEFKKCVRHHKETLSFVHKIESTYSNGFFLAFLSSVIVICFTGFMMVIAPFLSLQFIFLGIYLTCMMTEVAVYCWYGHDVMVTSDEIGLSFYMSNWYKSDLSLRESISIFLERTKKPVTLTGGKLVVLNLTTFTGILRSSYSFFAVLQRFYNGS